MDAPAIDSCGGPKKAKRSNSSTLLLLFGVNRLAASDVARTAALVAQGYEVITVSDAAGQLGEGTTHIHSFFGATDRSTRGIMKEVDEYIVAHRKRFDEIVVCLDYFWLENNYYEERYGTQWLMGKNPVGTNRAPGVRHSFAFRFLALGVTALWLPIDDGKRNLSSNMRKMLTQFRGAKKGTQLLHVKEEFKEANPLWKATALVERDAPDTLAGRSNSVVTTNYLPATGPAFLHIRLRE